MLTNLLMGLIHGAAPITNTNSATGNIGGLNSAANGPRRGFTFIPTVAYKSQFISMSTGSSTGAQVKKVP